MDKMIFENCLLEVLKVHCGRFRLSKNRLSLPENLKQLGHDRNDCILNTFSLFSRFRILYIPLPGCSNFHWL